MVTASAVPTAVMVLRAFPAIFAVVLVAVPMFFQALVVVLVVFSAAFAASFMARTKWVMFAPSRTTTERSVMVGVFLLFAVVVDVGGVSALVGVVSVVFVELVASFAPSGFDG